MENCSAALTAVAKGGKKDFVFTHVQEMLDLKKVKQTSSWQDFSELSALEGKLEVSRAGVSISISQIYSNTKPCSAYCLFTNPGTMFGRNQLGK